MSFDDTFTFQTRICPKCHDDHKQGDPCVMSFTPEHFSPAAEDQSYIATQYRRLESRIAELEAENARLKDDILKLHVPVEDREISWAVDLAKSEMRMSDLEAQNARYREALEYSHGAMAVLLENDGIECRGDEDCDHCVALDSQRATSEALKGDA